MEVQLLGWAGGSEHGNYQRLKLWYGILMPQVSTRASRAHVKIGSIFHCCLDGSVSFFQTAKPPFFKKLDCGDSMEMWSQLKAGRDRQLDDP